MQEVCILPLKKPGLQHLSQKSQTYALRGQILNEVRIGGSPPIKGTLLLRLNIGVFQPSVIGGLRWSHFPPCFNFLV